MIKFVFTHQDSCGSFDRLIPLLTKKASYLTIDLPGHGRSSWLPKGVNYHYMDIPILIRQLAKHFKWDKVSLMGHSYSSAASYSYGATFPESMDFLIALDGLYQITYNRHLDYYRKYMDCLVKYNNMGPEVKPPAYTMEELVKRMCESGTYKEEYCKHILQRNVSPSKTEPNKFYFTRDARLKCGVNWYNSTEEIVEECEQITFPVCAFEAERSVYFIDKELWELVSGKIRARNNHFEMHFVKGGNHHVHLNNPELICDTINNFLLKVCK